MAIVVESVTPTTKSNTTTGLTVAMPPTRPDGDLYLAFLSANAAGSGSQGFSVPGNWASAGNFASTSNAMNQVFWWAGSSEPASYSVTLDTGAYAIAHVIRLSGANIVTPNAGWGSNASDTAPSVTPTANGRAFRFYGQRPGAPSMSSGGHTTLASGSIGNSVNGIASLSAVMDAPAVQGTGTGTAVANSSGSTIRAGTLVIAEAPPPPPDQVTGLTATADGHDTIDLSWDAADGADTYDIERDSVIIETGWASTSYTDTGLDASTQYSYRVRGVNDEGPGDWSDAVQETTDPLPPVVVTPGTLSLTTSAFAPSAELSANRRVVPGTLELETVSAAPNVVASDHKTVEPGTLALETTGYAPEVTASDHQSAEPGTLALSTEGFAPDVALSDHKLVTPGALSLATTLYAPGVVATQDRLLTPGTLGLVAVGYAPDVDAGGGEATKIVPIAAGADDAHSFGAGIQAYEDYIQVFTTLLPRTAGLRFEANIPVGATINSAKISVIPLEGFDSVNADIHCEDIDNSPDFDTNPTTDGRNATSASTPWQASNLGTNRVESPDFSAALQETVDRANYAGEAVTVLLTTFEDPELFRFHAYESDPDLAARLHVTYVPPGPVLVRPSTLALTTTLYAPTATASDHQLVTPDTLALETVGYAPSLALSDNQRVIPSTLALETTAYAPSVVASDHQTVTPDLLELAVSAFAPRVSAGQSVHPLPLSLSTQGYAPGILLSDNQLVVPGTLDLETEPFAPTVLTPRTVVPDTLSLSTTGYAPAVDATENVTVIPGLLELATLGYAPVVTPTLHVLVRPNGAELAIVTYAPRAIVPRYLGTIRPKSGFSLAQPRPSAGGALSQPRPRGGSSLRQPRPRW